MRYDRYDVPIHWQWYDELQGYRDLVHHSISYLAGEKGNILDVGSGDGLVDSLLVAMGFAVTGIEPELEGCKIAWEKVPEMVILNTTLEEAHIPRVDYLYSLNTIEHVDKPELYAEVMKKVRHFGIIVTDNGEIHKGGKYHNQEFTMKELKNLFKDFKVEELDLGTKDFIGLKVYA